MEQVGLYKFYDIHGQATVEAAFLIPICSVLLLALLQPAILLFDHMVMELAINDVCRYVLTVGPDDAQTTTDERVVASEKASQTYAHKRLQAIPTIPMFHQGLWEVEVVGNELSDQVHIRIAHRVKPLPLIQSSMSLMGALDQSGLYYQEVELTRSLSSPWEQRTHSHEKS